MQLLLNRRRFVRPHAVVESIEIADPFLGKDPVAFFHFVHHPLESGDGFFRVGHHRHDEVREAIVHLHFDDLRVDHDEAKFVGAEFEKHRGNDRVDAHRLARAGRARDEQMRHGCQIADDRAAIDILAERERDFLLRRAKLRIVQQLAQRHGDLLAVGNFDADRVLARDRSEDVDSFRAGGACEVSLELRNSRNAQTGRRVNFVARDRRAARDIARSDFDAEGLERVDDDPLRLNQLIAIGLRRIFRIDRIEHIKARQLVVFESADR